jgi:hypothetical protein
MGVPVADFEFNLENVTSLAGKLKAANLDLSSEEHQLLLAIFAAAAARAQVTDPMARTSTLPLPEIIGQTSGTGPDLTLGDLQQQLLNAYIPGNYFQAVDTEVLKTVGLQGPANRSRRRKGATSPDT